MHTWLLTSSFTCKGRVEIRDPGGLVTANCQWKLEKANCSYVTKITKMHYINIIVICNKLNKRQRIYSIWMIFIFINNYLYRSKGKGFTKFWASFHQVVCGIIWKDTWTRIFIFRNLRGRPFDSEGGGGACTFWKYIFWPWKCWK